MYMSVCVRMEEMERVCVCVAVREREKKREREEEREREIVAIWPNWQTYSLHPSC